MKKFTTLLATSATVLGLAGCLTVANAENLSSDNAKLTTNLTNMQNPNSPAKNDYYTDFGLNAAAINKVASQYKSGESINDVENALNDNQFTAALYGYDSAKDALSDSYSRLKLATSGDNNSAEPNALQQMYNDANKVLEDLFQNNTGKTTNNVKAPAQQVTTSSSSKANNDVKAPAQNATTLNSSKANNGVKAAAQNTTANGATSNNDENTNAAGKTTTTAGTTTSK